MSTAGQPLEERIVAEGQIIAGKYRIEGLLGRGGMGVVARGRQLELDRPVAIKFLKPTLAVDARPMQRFAREARMIARMQSEHVVRVFDVGRENDVPFIVMEHLAGHDLAREIAKGPLSVERAVEFALHACEALGEAHSLGIVHRDVKPSNLFVAESFGGRESLKVLDFGVSKWLRFKPEAEAQLTTDGGPVGTPAFASPEQLTRPDAIDPRTDIWALGVVLYQSLSGELPFKADTIPQLYSQIISSAPTPFPSGRGVPAGLVTIIDRCLERDPDDRYGSMLDLARALQPYAPARAHAIVETLATLADPKSKRELEGAPEVSSPSTTLEFSQMTPEPKRGAVQSAEPLPRRLGVGVALFVGAAALLGVIALGSRRSGDAGSVTGTSERPAVALPSEPSVAAAAPTEVPAVAVESPPAVASLVQAPVAPPSAGPSKPSTATPARERSSRSAGAAAAARPGPSAPVASTAPAPSASVERRSDVIPLYRH